MNKTGIRKSIALRSGVQHSDFMILRPFLLLGIFCLALQGGDWPQWRGPARDGHASPSAWQPARLPTEIKPVWRIKVGGGHSSPVVSGVSLVYLDEAGGKEVVHCLDAATGREKWRKPFSDAYQDEWGAGPRSTPFFDGDRVYVQSCIGEFRCLAVKDGTEIWRVNFADFGVIFLGSKANQGTASRRGNTGSGVVDGSSVILPVGSTEGATLVCFDKFTGKVLWKSLGDEAAYSSLVTGNPGGVRQVMAFTADALAGVDVVTGKPLWRVPFKTDAKRHAATPVLYGNRVVVNSHTVGLVCVEIVPTGAGLEARTAWALKDQKINIATSVLSGQSLFSQGSNKDYICVDAATGELRWAKTGFGVGKKDYSSTIAVGNKLLVLSEDGQLVLLEANPGKYEELGRVQVCGNTWSFPALADGKLYVRDARELACIDLR